MLLSIVEHTSSLIYQKPEGLSMIMLYYKSCINIVVWQIEIKKY